MVVEKVNFVNDYLSFNKISRINRQINYKYLGDYIWCVTFQVLENDLLAMESSGKSQGNVFSKMYENAVLCVSNIICW